MKPEDWLELPEGLPPRLREYVEPVVTTERGRSLLHWAVGALAFLSLLAYLAAGANSPANPALGAPTTTTTLPAPKPSRVPSFNEVHFSVSQFPGLAQGTRHFCGLHAESPEQQAKGLMGRKDLANYDGMLFTFASDTDVPFYMKGVTIPLTVAFFDSAGRFLGSVEMKPCPARARNCPRFSAPGNVKYRYALEVQEGGLTRLGIGPGSTLNSGGGCI